MSETAETGNEGWGVLSIEEITRYGARQPEKEMSTIGRTHKGREKERPQDGQHTQSTEPAQKTEALKKTHISL
jgi:hypothetical protein